MSERQKKKTPWGLVFSALVFLFAGWVYFFEYEGAEKRENEKSQAAALVPFSNSSVLRIEIRAKPGGRPESDFVETVISRKSKDDPWFVEKPYADAADPAVIDTFLSNLSIEKAQETVEGDKATFGLDKPLAAVALTAASSVRKVAIGSVPAFDGSNYAEVDDSGKIATVSSTVIATLQKDPREFRDKRFFKASEHPEVSAIEIRSALDPRVAKASFVLELKEGVWVEQGALSQGAKASWPLNQETVKKYIESAQAIRGSDVWAEDKTQKSVLGLRKLDRPGLEVTLRPKDPAQPTYQIKLAPLPNSDVSVTAGVSSERPLVFAVYKAQFEALSKSLDHFRDMKHPFQFSVNDVQAIALDRAPGSVSLPHIVRREKSWEIDPKDTRFSERRLKPELVDELLSGIQSLEASRVSTGKDLRLVGSAIRMKILGAGVKPLIEFLFVVEGDVVRVTSSKIPGRIFEVAKSKFETLGFDLLTPPPEKGNLK